MKILKRLAIGVLFLIGILLVLAAFLPKEMNVRKTATIEASQGDVFKAVNELKTWEHWSPWNEADETIKNEYSDQSAGQGAYYTWTSENSGAGQMTITDVYGTDSLATLLEFDGQGNAIANFIFNPTENGIETTWTFKSVTAYPFNVFPYLMGVEKMLGGFYEKGLANLKSHVEANKTPAYEVTEMDFPATRYLAQQATVKMVDMAEHFQTVMPAVAAAFVENKVKMGGPPSGLFYTWDEENQSADVAIGIPAGADDAIEGLTAIDLPESRAFKIDYYGPFDGTVTAHETMADFLKRNLLENKSTLAIERYITDPSSEPDPEKWLTEVIYLLEN